MGFRKVLFWVHLASGCLAGSIILIMSVTGVLLTYERQTIAWADRGYRSVAPAAGATRLGVDELLEKARGQAGALPASFLLRRDPGAAAEASFGRERTVFFDVYTGAMLGEGSRAVRGFFRATTDWHRWLGVQGEGRQVGRAVTGACNLAFLFLVLSGIYLWLPKRWTWQHLRPVVLFQGRLAGKARDFNWHNVLGLWCAIPLAFVVLGAVVISYPWATKLLYSVTGSEAPAATQKGPAGRGSAESGRGPRGQRRGDEAGAVFRGVNEAWARAEQQVNGWRAISLRVPENAGAPLSFSIEEAERGRPDKRSQLTIERATGEARHETFDSYNRGRQLRTWLRWIHTGEAGGVAGQTIAGLASAGGAVLVWTGISLSLHRFRKWRARMKARTAVAVET